MLAVIFFNASGETRHGRAAGLWVPQATGLELSAGAVVTPESARLN